MRSGISDPSLEVAPKPAIVVSAPGFQLARSPTAAIFIGATLLGSASFISVTSLPVPFVTM